MAWLKEEDRHPAWEIWNLKWHCRMPYNQARSIEDIKQFGYISSGDQQLDRQRANQTWESMLTIAQMCDYFQEGADIRVRKKEDTVKIYNIISNHLEGWQRFLAVNINMKGPPLEDLILLDRFASVVYEHAKRLVPKEFEDTMAARQLKDAAGFSVDEMLVDERRINPATDQVEDGPVYPERRSYEDVFSSHRRKALRWR